MLTGLTWKAVKNRSSDSRSAFWVALRRLMSRLMKTMSVARPCSSRMTVLVCSIQPSVPSLRFQQNSTGVEPQGLSGSDRARNCR